MFESDDIECRHRDLNHRMIVLDDHLKSTVPVLMGIGLTFFPGEGPIGENHECHGRPDCRFHTILSRNIYQIRYNITLSMRMSLSICQASGNGGGNERPFSAHPRLYGFHATSQLLYRHTATSPARGR